MLNFGCLIKDMVLIVATIEIVNDGVDIVNGESYIRFDYNASSIII